MEGILNVTPQELINAANEFSSKGSNISTLTAEMTAQVESLSTVWEGDAANTYITKFKGLDDDIQLMNRMVQEHVTDLQEMAAKYSSTEEENVEDFSSLSSDVIV